MIQPSADPEASTALVARPELGGAFSSEPSRHLVIRVSVSVGGAENVHESEGRFTPAETRIGANPERIDDEAKTLEQGGP